MRDDFIRWGQRRIAMIKTPSGGWKSIATTNSGWGKSLSLDYMRANPYFERPNENVWFELFKWPAGVRRKVEREQIRVVNSEGERK